MKAYSSSPDRQAVLENCNFAKAALMLIVVAYHSILFWRGTWFTCDPVYTAEAYGWIARWFNSFHVYGFTLISGYIFRFLRHEKGKYARFLPFIGGKARRLLVPYICFALLWAAPFHQYYIGGLGWTAVIRNYLLGASPSHLWFLMMLFWVFTMAWPLTSWLEKSNVLTICMMIVFYGVSLAGGRIFPNYFQIWTACRHMVFFILGFSIRRLGCGLLMKIPSAAWIAAHLALFWFSNTVSGRISSGAINDALSLVCQVCGTLMAFVVLQKAAVRLPGLKKQVMRLSGDTMAVYLLHQQLIYICISLFNGRVNPWLHGVLNFILALGASLLITRLLRRFKIGRCMLGG